MPIKSPCILVCSIDRTTGWCFGCGRTSEEIGSWLAYTDAERDAVMEALPARVAQIVVPERRETKRRRMARERSERSS